MKKKALSASKAEGAFTKKCFRNWGKALADGFPSNKTYHVHREATMRIVEAPSATYGKIDASMSESFLYEQAQN